MPPVLVVSMIVLPLADTWSGAAVEADKVLMANSYWLPAVPFVAADVSPKVNAF